jgi:hypothetical protein
VAGASLISPSTGSLSVGIVSSTAGGIGVGFARILVGKKAKAIKISKLFI